MLSSATQSRVSSHFLKLIHTSIITAGPRSTLPCGFSHSHDLSGTSSTEQPSASGSAKVGSGTQTPDAVFTHGKSWSWLIKIQIQRWGHSVRMLLESNSYSRLIRSQKQEYFKLRILMEWKPKLFFLSAPLHYMQNSKSEMQLKFFDAVC